jgi:sulfur-carrier protein
LPITIRIPPPLRKFTGGEEAVESAAKNLAELFDGLELKFPGIKQTLCTPEGKPHRFVNIYVNEEDIRFLGGNEYTFRDGDEILLVPAIAGGNSIRSRRIILL